MFENHSCSQHKTNTQIKPDQIQIIQNNKVEKDFQGNTQFEECSFGDLSFVSSKDLQFHRSNKVGKNNLNNRLNTLNGKVEYDWLNLSIDSFKIKCKNEFLK